MAKKGGSPHLKRLAASASVLIRRKEAVWLTKQMPGAHGKKSSIALAVLLRDILKIADSSKEARNIINNGNVLVDGKIVREGKFSVGIMDIVSIPKLGKNYEVIIDNKGRLKLVEIDGDKAKFKLCRVNRKLTSKGGKIQIGLHDGRTIFVDNSYKIGDTVKLSIPKQEVLKVLKLEPNAKCLITKGRHSGEVAVIDELYPSSATRKAEAKLHSDNTSFITVRDYLFVVGDEF
jgi:small subunit ribosomal protein S4e